MRRLAWTLVGVVAFFALAAIFALVYAGPSALRAAREGRSALTTARDAFLDRDARAAGRQFVRAEGLFRSAERRLGSPLVWPMRLVPIANRQIVVGRSLALIGGRVAEAGRAASAAMSELPDRELKLEDGRVDLGAVEEAIGAFGGSVAAATDIGEELRSMPSGWVIGPLDRARSEALALLPSAVEGMLKGQKALESLPSLLADGTKKRYLIAFSNLSELRGSGGFIGFVTVLEAEDGDLDLEDVSGRPTELFPPPGETDASYPSWLPADLRSAGAIFQNINLSSDFPTAGRLIVDTARSALGQVDGVIGVDPVGLGAILNATGPIDIASWPDPIDADNVSRVAQHDVYLRIRNNQQREDFFAELVRTTFDRLVTDDVAFRPETFGTFDGAVRAGHFRMYSSHGEDQATFTELGLAGDAARAQAASDVLSLVTQNATGNKGDWFLRRSMRYDVRLDPIRRTASTELAVDFRNSAPSSGLPDYVIGAKAGGVERGTNRQILTLVRAAADELRGLQVGADQVTALQGPEGPLRGYRTAVDIRAGGSAEIRMTSTIPKAVQGTGSDRTYRLHVMPQPVVNADFLEVSIRAPAGWTVEGDSTFANELGRDLILEVRLRQTSRAWLFDKVVLEPWRVARDLLGRIF
ncbi:MAG: DUF4012 domain-containing protein [Actinomycetota bacterium]